MMGFCPAAQKWWEGGMRAGGNTHPPALVVLSADLTQQVKHARSSKRTTEPYNH